MLASGRNGRLYAGVTNDLVRRIYEHKECRGGKFTSKYGVYSLVYFEAYQTPYLAIQREKNIKHWPRRWKIALIEKANRDWRDLYPEIVR